MAFLICPTLAQQTLVSTVKPNWFKLADPKLEGGKGGVLIAKFKEVLTLRAMEVRGGGFEPSEGPSPKGYGGGTGSLCFRLPGFES